MVEKAPARKVSLPHSQCTNWPQQWILHGALHAALPEWGLLHFQQRNRLWILLPPRPWWYILELYLFIWWELQILLLLAQGSLTCFLTMTFYNIYTYNIYLILLPIYKAQFIVIFLHVILGYIEVNVSMRSFIILKIHLSRVLCFNNCCWIFHC